MKAYKLFRKRKDGSLGPLFIAMGMRVPIGVAMQAEFHPTKGFAERKGWHCMPQPKASHLVERPDRVWCEVEIEGVEHLTWREQTWLIADQLTVIRELEN
jgi:hypothetical protein